MANTIAHPTPSWHWRVRNSQCPPERFWARRAVPWPRAAAGACLALLGACGPRSSSTVRDPVGRRATVCEEATPLAFGQVVFGSNRGGAATRTASCVSEQGPECGFVFEVSKPSAVRFGLMTLSFNGALALYELIGGTPREQHCVDDTPFGNTRHAQIDRVLDPGRYLLVVDSSDGGTGDFELFSQAIPLPDRSELCARATSVAPARPVYGSLRGRPDVFAAPCLGESGGPDAVHSFLLEQPARVRFLLDAEHDGLLAIDGACAKPGQVSACGQADPLRQRSLVAAELPAGRHYVLVDGVGRVANGDYLLSMERSIVPPPASLAEVCAQAQRWSGTPALVEIDTLNARSTLSGSCGGVGAPEVPIRLTVERPSLLVAELRDAELDAALYLRRHCEDGRSELACVQASRESTWSLDTPVQRAPLHMELAPGEYVLVVDGQTASDLGAASLSLALSPIEASPGPEPSSGRRP